MATFVRFWGTRGSIPTPGYATRRYGGNTSCVEVRIDDALFICDGGTGLRELGMHLLSRKLPEIEAHMFFSHMHWDHIQGFPFFVPAYSPKTSLHVYEVAAGDNRVKQLLHGQMRSEYFPVRFSDLGSSIISQSFESSQTQVAGVRIRCIEQTHPGRSFAYSFEKNGTKVVYATDNELDLTLLDGPQAERHPERLRRLPQDFVTFCEGASLLISDGQYTDEEYPLKVGWGHARTSTVVDLAVQAGVEQLALFHHDPMHTDAFVDQKVEAARQRAAAHGAKLVIFGAREGLEMKFGS